MTQDFELPRRFQIRYKGVFNYDAIYRHIFKWLKERKFNVHEPKNKRKPDSAWGYEDEIFIFAERKVDAYYQYKAFFIIHGRDCADVEINGKKLTNGRVNIVLRLWMTTDYSGRFETNKFTKFLERIYNGSIIDMEIDLIHLDAMHYRAQEVN